MEMLPNVTGPFSMFTCEPKYGNTDNFMSLNTKYKVQNLAPSYAVYSLFAYKCSIIIIVW